MALDQDAMSAGEDHFLRTVILAGTDRGHIYRNEKASTHL